MVLGNQLGIGVLVAVIAYLLLVGVKQLKPIASVLGIAAVVGCWMALTAIGPLQQNIVVRDFLFFAILTGTSIKVFICGNIPNRLAGAIGIIIGLAILFTSPPLNGIDWGDFAPIMDALNDAMTHVLNRAGG